MCRVSFGSTLPMPVIAPTRPAIDEAVEYLQVSTPTNSEISGETPAMCSAA